MANDTDGQANQGTLEAQMEAASDVIRAAALRLLPEGEVHPHILVAAATRVAAELAAGAALAGGDDAEAVLGELAEVMRQAGREHGAMPRAEPSPAAGKA